MRQVIILAIVVSCIAPTVSGVAAAQAAGNTTSTPTPSGSTNVTAPPDAPGAELVVDSSVVVTDYRYSDGQMILKVWSDEYKPLSVAPRAPSSDTGTVQARTFVVDADRITTVRIASPGGVTLWTSESVDENGQFHFIRKPSTFFIRGPWSGSDVRDGALGGALGVALAVLYEAVSAKVGATERGERLA